MMKYYIVPEIEVATFRMEDVVTVSGEVTPTPTPDAWTRNDVNNPAEYNGVLMDF